MVIGITGPLGCGKEKVFELIKARAMEKYMYLDTDNIIISILKPGTTCYNYVIEVLGDRIEKYKKGKDLRKIFKKDLMLYNAEDYKLFMDAVQPFVSCRIAKLSLSYPKKLIFVASNNLYDYDWGEKCDRIIYVDTPAEKRRKRLMDRDVYGTNHYRDIENLFMPIEEQKKKADIILEDTDRLTLKRGVKKMLNDLVSFKKFVDKGMVPLPTVEVRQKDADRLEEVRKERQKVEEKSNEPIVETKPKRRGRPPKKKD